MTSGSLTHSIIVGFPYSSFNRVGVVGVVWFDEDRVMVRLRSVREGVRVSGRLGMFGSIISGWGSGIWLVLLWGRSRFG